MNSLKKIDELLNILDKKSNNINFFDFLKKAEGEWTLAFNMHGSVEFGENSMPELKNINMYHITRDEYYYFDSGAIYLYDNYGHKYMRPSVIKDSFQEYVSWYYGYQKGKKEIDNIVNRIDYDRALQYYLNIRNDDNPNELWGIFFIPENREKVIKNGFDVYHQVDPVINNYYLSLKDFKQQVINNLENEYDSYRERIDAFDLFKNINKNLKLHVCNFVCMNYNTRGWR